MMKACQGTSANISAANNLPWNMVAKPRTPATLPTPNICNKANLADRSFTAAQKWDSVYSGFC